MTSKLAPVEQALSKATSAPLSREWMPREDEVRLSRQTFREGLRLIRPFLSKPLTRDAAVAYWIACCGFRDVDFREGVKFALGEKWISPAVLIECCQLAEGERITEERQQQQQARDQEYAQAAAQARREREARKGQLEGERSGWALPPTTPEDLLHRLLVTFELDSARPSLLATIRDAKASGTVENLALVIPADLVSYARLQAAEFARAAAALTGRPVAVAFREAA